MELTGPWIKALAFAGLTFSIVDRFIVAEASEVPQPFVTEDLLDKTQASGLEEIWQVHQGTWEVEAGLLRGHCDDSGCAAISLRAPLKRNEYELEVRFRLVEAAKALQLVFHADSVQAEKEGGLFSIVALSGATKILRHRDQAVRGDQTRAVAEVFHSREAGVWHRLLVRCSGGEVAVSIDGEELLRATHLDFALNSGSARLRAVGGTVEIGELLLHVPVPAGDVE